MPCRAAGAPLFVPSCCISRVVRLVWYCLPYDGAWVYARSFDPWMLVVDSVPCSWATAVIVVLSSSTVFVLLLRVSERGTEVGLGLSGSLRFSCLCFNSAVFVPVVAASVLLSRVVCWWRRFLHVFGCALFGLCSGAKCQPPC